MRFIIMRVFSLLFLAFICFVPVTTHAAFYSKKPITDSVQIATNQNCLPFEYTTQETAKLYLFNTFPAKDRSFKHGALAYISLACGVLGIAIISVHTVALIMILGLAAGVFGKLGVKKYKHDKMLKTFCYIGIVLGALLVLLGTIPLLLI